MELIMEMIEDLAILLMRMREVLGRNSETSVLSEF
jgi:hypothetical protein